jgi:hypothetical protein
MFHARLRLLISTVALARCQNAPIARQLFSTVFQLHPKAVELKRLEFPFPARHRAEATVLMENCPNKREIFRLAVTAHPMTIRCIDSGRFAATRVTTFPLSRFTSAARRLPPSTTASTPNVAAISMIVSAGESLTL